VKFPQSFDIARWGGSTENSLVLTFDDGPNLTNTPAILSILRRYGIPAAFFVTGAQVNRLPDLARRIVSEGHEIGNHTYTHPDLSEVSDVQLRMEVNSTQRVIESVTGRATLLFRPPFATDIEPRTMEQMGVIGAASSRGYYTVGMGIDGLDWRLSRADAIAQRVIQGARNGSGHIVLLHDSGGNREETVKALPIIIETLRSEGFRFVSLADLIGKTRDDLMPAVTTSADPLLALDDLSYTSLRAFEGLLYSAFVVVIGLGMARAGLVAALAIPGRKATHVNGGGASTIGVLIAAYNEEKVICNTILSVLQNEQVHLEVLVVDDGSTDQTADLVRRSFSADPRVRVVTKVNGGKADALNYGLKLLCNDIIVALDADTVFLPHTIKELTKGFADPTVGAVAGNAKVGNRVNLLTRFQALEYIVAQNLERRAFERLNCISVVPGAVGAWRREAVIRVGGFQSDTLAEDADLTLRIIRAGDRVVYADQAIALTEAPVDVRSFLKQRFRWTFGMLQTAVKHSSALTSSKPNAVGFVTLPNIIFFQFAFNCLAPVADLLLFFSFISAGLSAYFHPGVGIDQGLWHIIMFYAALLACRCIPSCRSIHQGA
jgi:cellulose synthase/poly-beta-1,6-N-acetylglucosamine synthase-like glycosyltransferase/peptidoglycan/xylan/chitin deacetylase (PgdA/CDA1 family)